MSIQEGDKLIQLTPPSISSGGNSLTVKGRLVFYPPGSSDPEPIKRARVRVRDNEGVRIDETLASGYTDYNGYFSFSGINNNDGRLQGGRDIYVEVFAENWAVDVVDNPQWMQWPPWEDPTYHANNKDDTREDVSDNSIIDFGTMSPEHPGAYNILNTVLTGWNFLKAKQGVSAPKVKVFFKDLFTPSSSYCMPSSIPERFSVPDWAAILSLVLGFESFFIADMALEAALSSLIGIHIQDDDLDQWHEDVILHEYGHYVMDQYADFWPPDTKVIGGHVYTTPYFPEHAWGEGWAHFFSAVTRHWAGYSDYRMQGNHDIEGNEQYSYQGDSVEGAVAGILWDVYDGYDPVSEPDDSVTLGFDSIWNILRNYNPPGEPDHPWNIYDFWDGLAANPPPEWQFPTFISCLWRIFDFHGVRILDDVPPNNPTSYSSTHTVGESSWGDKIRVVVDGDYDDLSGVDGYSVIWDNSPFTLPPETLNARVRTVVSPTLSEGLEWYFHLRTVDYAGNWATDTFHVGPFLVKIETTDDDETGPTFSNPASYWEMREKWVPQSTLEDYYLGVVTLSIDVTDPSGISDVRFGLEGWPYMYPYTGFSGNTYWVDYYLHSWELPYGYLPQLGWTVEWVVEASDDDNEGWQDKARAISVFRTQLEAPPDGFGISSGVDISIEPPSNVVEVGGFTAYQIFISNTGNMLGTYSLTLQGLDPSWFSFSTDLVEVEPGQTESVALTVAPAYVPMILEDCQFTVTATSLEDPGVFDTADAVISVTGPTLEITAYSPVNILVTVPSGLITGYDPETETTINEIPGAAYSGPESEPQVVQIPNALIGHYTVDIFGTDTGPYTITMEFLAFDRTTIDTVTWTGIIEPGQRYTETVEVRPDGTIAGITPPTTEITLTGILGLNDWYVSDVVVTLTATDRLPGVSLTQYGFDGANWINYTGQFTINLEGTSTIYYNSTDKARNIEETKSTIMKLDTTLPTVNIVNPPAEYALQDGVTFLVSATDIGSGISSVKLSIRDAAGNPVGFGDMSPTFDPLTNLWNLNFDTLQLPDGYYTATATATDNAGNTVSTTASISIRNACILGYILVVIIALASCAIVGFIYLKRRKPVQIQHANTRNACMHSRE